MTTTPAMDRYLRWLAAGCPSDDAEPDRAPFDDRPASIEPPLRSDRWKRPPRDFVPRHIPFDTRASGYPLQAPKQDV